MSILKRAKEYQKNNKEKINKKSEKYYLKNKDKIKVQRKTREDENREYWRNYRSKNRKKVNKLNIKYMKNRKARDPDFKIICKLRTRLWLALQKYKETGKAPKSRKYGVDYKAILEHLKPFPADISKSTTRFFHQCCVYI